MKFEGKIRLGGKEYSVSVVNGERLVEVDGRNLSVDEFFKTLSPEIVARLAFVGKIALQDEKFGIKPKKGKYQYLAEDLPESLK